MKLHELFVDELFGNPAFRDAVMASLVARGGSLEIPDGATRIDAPALAPVVLHPPESPVAGDGYRLLDADETVQPGDEWTLASNPGRGWRTVEDSVGTPASRWTRSVFRRRTAPTNPAPEYRTEVRWGEPGILPPHTNDDMPPPSNDYQYAIVAEPFALPYETEWVSASLRDSCWAQIRRDQHRIPNPSGWVLRRLVPQSTSGPRTFVMDELPWGEPGVWPEQSTGNPTSAESRSTAYRYAFIRRGDMVATPDRGNRPQWVAANTYDTIWIAIGYYRPFGQDTVLRIPVAST